jgi:hypothetical protein
MDDAATAAAPARAAEEKTESFKCMLMMFGGKKSNGLLRTVGLAVARVLMASQGKELTTSGEKFLLLWVQNSFLALVVGFDCYYQQHSQRDGIFW